MVRALRRHPYHPRKYPTSPPIQLDEASLLDDLHRPPEARLHPLVLPTHLRKPAGGSPTPAQEAYVRSITPVFVALRRLLALAAVDGGVMLRARRDIEEKVLVVRHAFLGIPPPSARWAVLLALLVLPQRMCRWLAQREVAKAKVGSVEEGEARVEELATELLARVPWAGHTWEPLQEQLSDGEREKLERELEQERKGMVVRYRMAARVVWQCWMEQDREGPVPGAM